MNKHWARWIIASISNHFLSLEDFIAIANWTDGESKVPILIEGDHRPNHEFPRHVELRVDGPYIVELSKDYYQIDVEINILVSVAMGEVDAHLAQRTNGLVVAAFSKCIGVYKYGMDDDDDQSFLGELKRLDHPKGTRGDRIETSYFGQIATDVKVIQSTIEAHYEMRLRSQ